jgi:hypothetical protein
MELRPESDRFGPDDTRWAGQVNTLLVDLQERAGTLRSTSSPAGGTKGSVEAIVLALGSAGAITALVEVIKEWLGRDRSRRLVITKVNEGHGRCAITIDGDNIDNVTIREAVRAVAGLGDV